ncbi:MAG: hypothetical protein UW61_C0012G0001, partial [Candidatus Curtissbacteria bacterium GW2011_GWC1_44_33]
MKKLFVFIALLATLIPAIFVIYQVGGWGNWQGTLPRGTTDSLYYYARIHEVTDGHALIGNPYVYENRGGITPAQFLPDIVSAVPMLLGLPFNLAVMVNMFVWSLVFLTLTFVLYRLLRVPRWWAFLWSVITYVGVYSFVIKPTVMQIVYPVFLVFLIVLLKFLHEPHNRRIQFLLSIVAASAFYTYGYLSYFVLLTFTFIFFWYLFTRCFKELRALVTVGVFSGLLLIPFGFLTLMQMSDPYYLETFRRLGLVYTHIPAIEAFFFGRWIVIGLIALGLLWKFFPNNDEDDWVRRVFWLATGAALLVGLVLNIITGVEFTLAIHMGRFVRVWMVIILGFGIYEWYMRARLPVPEVTGKNKQVKYIIVALFLLILLGGVLRTIPRGLEFFKYNNRGQGIVDSQTYAPPLKWLDLHEPEESVIWANDSIAQYIPIMTRHYPLFAPQTVLHSIRAQDLETRYLLSRSLDILTIEDLKRDFGLHSGGGPAKEQPLAQNRQAWLCTKAKYLFSGLQCPPYTDPITYQGDEYFETMIQR